MARKRVALLIGVNDYSTYDRERGLPPGTSSLRAPAHDVRWMYRQCLRLGYEPRHIVVCTSPSVDPVALGFPAGTPNVRGATAQELRDAMQWVREQGGAGFVYWSGHGAVTEDGHLLICPADTGWDGKELTNALSTDAVAELLPPGTEIVLDTCHAGAGRSLTPDRAVPVDAPRFDGHFLLAACASHEVAEERVFHGEWHGAFTWAVTSLLDQWNSHKRGKKAYLGVTHEELTLRSRALLAALGSEQSPVYSGPPDVVFGAVPGAPAVAPDRPVTQTQVWSGDTNSFKEFRIQVGGVNVGWYVTLGATCNMSTIPAPWNTLFSPGKEYWYWQSGQSPFPATFTLVPQAGWDQGTPTSGWTWLPCSPIPTSPTGYTPPANSWKVTLTGTSTYYWMARALVSGKWQQTWYAQGSGSVYIGNGSQTLTFATVASPTGSWGRLIQTETAL